MCGFAGIYHFDGALAPDAVRASVDAMLSSIAHRGPDDSSMLQLPFATVGFRRLSIVDLHTGGQPVKNRDGTIHVFFNGEIYNHEELRRRLRAEHGIDVVGGSDAAVLPHLYQCYGERFVDLCNGMFAICVLDSRDRSVRLYRDRLGIKPLYCARTRHGVVFGSELKPLWCGGMVAPAIDTAQVVPYLDFFYVPGRATMAAGVQKVMPAECLVLRPDGERSFRYWSLATPQPLRAGDAIDELDALLADATRLQLMADVPIGISLSGGLDSSLIAYYSNAGAANVTAYTITFPDTNPEELACARAVARALRIDHKELAAQQTDFLDDIDAAITFNDEPVADPAFLPALQVSRAAREHVRVLLSGCGADELFAGYGHYRLTRRATAYRLLALAFGDKIAARTTGIDRTAEQRAAIRVFPRDRMPHHAAAMTHLRPSDRAALRHLTSVDTLAEMAAAFGDARWMDGRNSQLYVDSVTYLPHQLLSMLDRTTMGASIEGRVPFLDHRVAELAMAVHGDEKYAGYRGNKWLLRQLGRRHLPPQVAARRKQGFPNQLQGWLVPERLAAVRDRLLDRGGFARGFFPRPWLEGLLANGQALRENDLLVHSLLVLDAWHRAFVAPRHSGHDPNPKPTSARS